MDLNLVWIVAPNLYFITTILTYAYYLRHDFLRENAISKIGVLKSQYFCSLLVNSQTKFHR